VIFSLVLSLVVAAGAQGGACPNSGNATDPYGYICGSIYKVTSDYSYGYGVKPNRPYSVKLCKTGGSPFQCYMGATEYAPDGYGYYGYDQFQIKPGGDSEGYWDLYAWSDVDHWGSNSVPVRRIYSYPAGAYGAGSNLPPAPYGSTPVYPANGDLNVPSTGTITVHWTNGLDSDRTTSVWPATYEIWYKHWDFGASEPAYFSLSATLQCNADYTGNCTTYVPNMTPGHWKWKVVVLLDVSNSVSLRPAVFRTDSGPEASFDVH
jgi:hypothetical protein